MIKQLSLHILLTLYVLLMVAPKDVYADLLMIVSGKVVAADNGAPLSGVTLRLLSPEKGKVAEVQSNAQGVFVIKDVRKGAYSIWAVSDDPFVVSSSTTIPVTVPDGKNVVGIGIKMQRGGAIKGKVVTSTGKVVSQATVLGSFSPATTDATGGFLLKGVPAGLMTLAVTAPSIAAKGFSVTSEIGKVVDVGNITLPVGAASAIRGTIVDSAGNPISGVIVTATSDSAPGGYAMSSSTGSFLITGLSTAKFKISTIKYSYEQFVLADVSVPSTALNIKLAPSQVNVAGILERFSNDNKTPVERMYSDSVIPAYWGSFSHYEGYPEDEHLCIGGEWIGTSIDLTAGLNIPVINISWGGSYSVGGLMCSNGGVEFGFSQECNYGGVGRENFANLSFGGSLIGVRGACDAKDIAPLWRPDGTPRLGESDGVLIAGSAGIHNGGVALDWSGPVWSLTISYALGLPYIANLNSLLPGTVPARILGLDTLSGVGRHCKSKVLRAGLPEGEILDLGI